MKPAVEMFCEECGTKLLVPHLVGKRKTRKVVCSKCFKEEKK